MDFRFAIAIQCVQLNRRSTDFNTRAGNESAERRRDLSTWMLIERLQHKHALSENSWQHHNHYVAAIARIKQPSRGLGMRFMVLYQIANDQIGVDEPSFAHRMLSRPRAAFAAASRIWAKDIPLPFLLASTPLSARMPRCTRMVAWSPSTAYSSLSPALIRNALRIFPGMVVCPLLVTLEWNNITRSLLLFRFLTFQLSLTLFWLARPKTSQ